MTYARTAIMLIGFAFGLWFFVYHNLFLGLAVCLFSVCAIPGMKKSVPDSGSQIFIGIDPAQPGSKFCTVATVRHDGEGNMIVESIKQVRIDS